MSCLWDRSPSRRPGYSAARVQSGGQEAVWILAAVDARPRMEKALREGFYLARIHDGQLELQVPDGFKPRAF